MTRRGLLLTMTEPPPAMEEEFNAWYDSEHLPERLAIPGFLSVQRWHADLTPGTGTYLATYELASAEVLSSPAYLARFRDAPTPWTKRVLGHCTVFRRWACEQILPGNAAPHPDARALFLACGDVPCEHEAEFNRWYAEEHVPLLSRVPGVLSARRFFDPLGAPRYVALYELENDQVPELAQWHAAAITDWAKRIEELTARVEWLLRVYRAYLPPAASPSAPAD